MDNKIYDKLNQELKPGDIVAYGHALGRCAGLRIGKVVGAEKDGRNYKIWIVGVDGEHRPTKTLVRRSPLLYPSRMIVLNPATVPDDVMRLLEPVPLDGE